MEPFHQVSDTLQNICTLIMYCNMGRHVSKPDFMSVTDLQTFLEVEQRVREICLSKHDTIVQVIVCVTLHTIMNQFTTVCDKHFVMVECSEQDSNK